MGRILAIDYGTKRTGLAVTDPLQMIAGGLKTVQTSGIWEFLSHYLSKEEVETIVVGKPLQLNNLPSENYAQVEVFVKKLKIKYPAVRVAYMDERFTSSMAEKALIEGGWKKKDRQEKGRVDQISAVFILQSFLETQNNNL